MATLMRAQQDPMFTHYMYNTLWLNPAYAGTRDLITITGIHRSQWVSFDGAPQDQSLTIHSPVGIHKKFGAGLSLINDKIGPVKSTWTAIDLSYTLKLNKKAKLSMGFKGLCNFYRNNVSQLKLTVQSDPSFANDVRATLPNAGAGFYYHTPKFYAGISSPRLIENKLNTSASALSKEQRHYFFIAGGVMNVSRNVLFKPTTFIKTTIGAPVEADVTGTFIFDSKFYAGLMYRSGDALGLLVGIDVSEQMYVGYSFDWSFANTTGRYNSGSHEIMVRYDLVYKSEGKIKSPRYF